MLPAFSAEQNWTSCLRHYGGQHSRFSGIELSDLQYNDSQGILTRFLQLSCHQTDDFAAPAWLANLPSQGPGPLYLIEVKSTTSFDHATPFFVSLAQYERVSPFSIPIYYILVLQKEVLKLCISTTC